MTARPAPPLLRGLTLAALIAGGALAVVVFASTPRAGAPQFRGFAFANQDSSGEIWRWMAHEARITVPDNGWRPLRLSVRLRAADGRAPLPVDVLVDDIPMVHDVVDAGGREHRVVVSRASPRPDLLSHAQWKLTAPPVLSVRIVVPAGADEPQMGVADIVVSPMRHSARGVLWAVAGALAGVFAWMWLWGIGAPWASATAAAAVLGASACAAAGYAESGRRLAEALWSGPAALGVDAFWPWAKTLAFAPATVLHVTGIVAFLTLPGWLALNAWPRLGVDGRGEHDALLAMPLSALMIGAAFLVLQAAGASDLWFTGTFAAVFGGTGVAIASSARRRAALLQFVRDNRWFLLLEILVPVCALFYLSVGLQDSGDVISGSVAAQRNLHVLPIDDDVSWLTSITWRRHLEANALFPSIYKIGNRGPLFAVLYSFYARAIDPQLEFYAHYLRVGVVLNGTIAAAVFALVRRWSTPRVAWASAALIALNPWFFLNVYYTWPKVFGAYFLLAAIVLLWTGAKPTLSRFVWAGVLAGLGGLAHPGNLLSMPVFFLVTIALNVRSVRAGLWSLALPALTAIVQLPWMIYTRIYSPGPNNLIIMHYLGGKDYFQPLAVRWDGFLAEHPWSEQLRVRWDSIVTLWWRQAEWAAVGRWWTGRWNRVFLLRTIYQPEFYYPLHSAGLLWAPWLAVGLIVNLVASRLRGPRTTPHALWEIRLLDALFLRARPGLMQLWPVPIVVGFAIVSLTLNQFARWELPRSHELPYGEVVLLAVAVVYVLRYLGWFYWLAALAAILVRQFQYFSLSAATSQLRLPAFDANGLLFWLTVAAIVGPAFLIRDRRSEAPLTA